MREEPGGAKSVRRRIVVIEDNADAAESLKLLLELNGHEVHVSEDGPEGLKVIHDVRPDVVLCDIGLPGMDGYEVARKVREDDTVAGVFLVALTGYGQEKDARNAERAGFDVHLTKPVDLEGLERLMQRLNEPNPGPR